MSAEGTPLVTSTSTRSAARGGEEGAHDSPQAPSFVQGVVHSYEYSPIWTEPLAKW